MIHYNVDGISAHSPPIVTLMLCDKWLCGLTMAFAYASILSIIKLMHPVSMCACSLHYTLTMHMYEVTQCLEGSTIGNIANINERVTMCIIII